jgi:phosphonopyruvate decarboxylase
MGPITPAMLDAMEIPWEPFPADAAAIEPALDRAIAHMDTSGRPYALVMQKGSVAPYPLRGGDRTSVGIEAIAPRFDRSGGASPSRHDALNAVVNATSPERTVVFASTGFCGRELYAIDDRANQLYMVGSMGCVSSLALGFALARPDLDVIALDGDGAALMRMGAFATVGRYRPANLTHVLLDNGEHESTGGQATVASSVSFAAVAAACGYASAVDSDRLASLDELLVARRQDGPRFLRLAIAPGTPPDLPRPTVTPVDVGLRLMRHIGAIH